MPFRDLLAAVLRGDEASSLTSEARERLEELAREAAAEGEITFVRDECAARMRQPGASHGVEYLLAIACAFNGEMERAHQTLLTLGDALTGESAWEPLAAVAERALELSETQAAARHLVKGHEGLGVDPARLEALRRARDIMPDDLELGLLLAVRLGGAGLGDERRALLSELMPRFAAEGRHAGLEEAALEFAEHGHVDGLVALLRCLPEVAGDDPNRECRQLVEIAFPAVARAERAGEVADALRHVAVRAEQDAGSVAAEPLRGPLATALRQGPGRALPDADVVFANMKLDDASTPIAAALERFDGIAALPPGRAVMHDAFGPGRITGNDAETVTMDFAHKRGHTMPYAAARRTLAPVDDDDLRLLRVDDPAALDRMRTDAPAEALWRTLKALGGETDATKLKRFMVGSQLVPAKEWTTFWRKARAAAEKDPRIDTSRAYEQTYRAFATGEVQAVGPDAAADVPLPAIEPRKSLRSNLATLRKFLAQHPDAEQALAGRFGKLVTRGVIDADADKVDRARAGLLFARWFPDRAGEWRSVLRDLWEQGLAVSDLSGEDEQLALLEASHTAGVAADAILSGLDSRFAAVRQVAAGLQEHLDDDARAELRTTLLRHAPRYPAAALRQIEEALASPLEAVEAWGLLAAAFAILESGPKASFADRIISWLAPDGLFDRAIAGRPCPEDQRMQLRVRLRQWRSSDRLLFPALETAERLGLSEEAELVRSARQQKTERLFDRVGQVADDADVPIMSRATHERLKKELERMERELKTTIPAAIQKARELGDLKENAEYHSAKLKQANVSKLVAALGLRLARARFVEDAGYTDGTVGLGTEVVLESDRDVLTYWILGEGEHAHGDHVVSHAAPVGRALIGLTIGDEVALGEGDARASYRVVSVERKLPDVEPQS